MKKLFLNFYCILFLFNTVDLRSAIQEKILIKVDNEIISSYDLSNQIKTILFLSNREINNSNITQFKKVAFENLINLRIKKNEILKKKISIDENNINNYLNKISKNNISQFKKQFEINDINYEIYLENVKTELSWQKLIFSVYSEKINVTETEIESTAKSILKNKKNINEYNFSKLEIVYNSDNELRNKIQKINDIILQSDIDQAADKLKLTEPEVIKSELGWVNESILSNLILDKIKNLKKGEISPPIVISNSMIFLKLNDMRELSTKNIDLKKLKNDILNQKQNEILSLYSKNYLSKLRNNTLIEFYE